MAIKRILVPLPGPAEYSGGIEMALSAADVLKAHVEALFISQPPPPQRTGGESVVFQEPLASWREESEKRAEEARQGFIQACAARKVRLLDVGQLPEDPPTGFWRQAEGTYESVTVKRSVAFDLVVATSAAVVQSLRSIAESSLLQTRRPVLLAPLKLESRLTDTAIIAWDESPECWHAASAAIPFLKRAEAVEVIGVAKDETTWRASHEDLFAYLHCHGVSASARIIEGRSSSVGEILLATAAEARAGLLVMGAYSHSRLREMLLGGATRHILINAAATPVLMAH